MSSPSIQPGPICSKHTFSELESMPYALQVSKDLINSMPLGENPASAVVQRSQASPPRPPISDLGSLDSHSDSQLSLRLLDVTGKHGETLRKKEWQPVAALFKALLLPTLTSPPEARPLGDMSPKFLGGGSVAPVVRARAR